MNNYTFITDFEASRYGRIGASDIAAFFPDPERPGESLAGYGRTAVNVVAEKTGELEREPAGKPADAGHHWENLALKWFIGDAIDVDSNHYSNTFYGMKTAYEASLILKERDIDISRFQLGTIKHSTEFINGRKIAHPDMLFMGNPAMEKKTARRIVNGVKFNLNKPFIVEAKAQCSGAVKRRPGSRFHGYDFSVTDYTGIPLKFYYQIQYQLALAGIDVAYLALLYDTNRFAFWRVDAHRRTQRKIMKVVDKIIRHIENRTLPWRFSVSDADLLMCYPRIEKDYRIVSGRNEAALKEKCRRYAEINYEIKMLEREKSELRNTIGRTLADAGEIRDTDGEVVACWKNRKGGKRIKALSKIELENPVEYRYLERKGLIEYTNDSRAVDPVWKGDE